MAGFYSDELIEEIKSKNDIVSVIGEYINLQKKGKGYMGLCPFHKEKTPSFSVVDTGQYFNCFGCGKGGDVFHFVMLSENLDYKEAVRYLADRAGINLPEGDDETAEQQKAALRKELIAINTEAARYFYALLHDGKHPEPLRYLENRGITPSTARKFGLGFSDDNWDSLFKHLTARGHKPENIFTGGLALKNKNGGYYDRFRNRIMYPIFDILGNVIAFGGRVMDDSKPKYMNSPETPLYQKSKVLYALNFARKVSNEKLVLVEGYMDVISLYQGGITNAVGSLGTALTEQHGRLLKKYCSEVVISYDSDSAGQTATMRGLDLLDSLGCNVKVLLLPEGKDPDEFIRKNGKPAYEKLISQALPLFEYKVLKLKNTHNTEKVDERIKFLNGVAYLLSKITNNVEREMYCKKMSSEYGISEEALLTEVYKHLGPGKDMKKIIGGSIGQPAVAEAEAARKAAGGADDGKDAALVHFERLIICLICMDNSVYPSVKDRFIPEDFSNGTNRELAAYVKMLLDDGREATISGLLSRVDERVAPEFTGMIARDCNCEDVGKAVRDIFLRLDGIKTERRMNEIIKLLRDYESDPGKIAERSTLEKELQDLLSKKSNLSVRNK